VEFSHFVIVCCSSNIPPYTDFSIAWTDIKGTRSRVICIGMDYWNLIYLTSQYSWNTAKVGVKHQSINIFMYVSWYWNSSNIITGVGCKADRWKRLILLIYIKTRRGRFSEVLIWNIIKMMPNKKYLIEKNRNKKQNNKLKYSNKSIFPYLIFFLSENLHPFALNKKKYPHMPYPFK
jgi:hypothetical protein